MNKTLLLAGVATALFTYGAQALEYTPYVSAKAAYGWMQNDIDYNFHYMKGPRDDGYAKDHKDNIWGLRLAAGSATPLNHGQLRTEFEFGWNTNSKDSKAHSISKSSSARLPYDLESKLSVYSAMLNVYYDFNTSSALRPYVGAGFGLAHLKNKTTVSANYNSKLVEVPDDTSENHIAWNIGLGVNYALSDKVTLDLGYRYTNYGKISKARCAAMSKFTGQSSNGTMFSKEELKVSSHDVLLGLRYAF